MKPTQVLLTAIFFAVIGVLVASIRGVIFNLKLRRIRKERAGKGFTRERFIDSFRSIAVPETIAAAVFDYYSSRWLWKDFPFSPDDTYAQDAL